MFRRLDFAIGTASPTPPFITIVDIARAKPLTCPPVIDGDELGHELVCDGLRGHGGPPATEG
jgi:hypothetical protein